MNLNLKTIRPKDPNYVYRIASKIEAANGFGLTLYICVLGPFFYNYFKEFMSEGQAVSLSALIFGIRSLFMALFEIPTGVIGDSIGRKKTIVWSLCFNSIFFLTLSLIPFVTSKIFVIVLAILSQFFYAIAKTFYSGTFQAWCVDTFRENNEGKNYGELISRIEIWNGVGQIVGAVLGVVTFFFGYVYLGFGAGALILSLMIPYSLAEIHDEENIDYIDVKKANLSEIFKKFGETLQYGLKIFSRSQKILSTVLFSSGIITLSALLSYLWPVYVNSNYSGLPKLWMWLGLVVSMLLFTILGSKISEIISKKYNHLHRVEFDKKIVMIISIAAIVMTGAVFVMSLATKGGWDSFALLVMTIFVAEFAVGIAYPMVSTLLNHAIPEGHANQRSTVLSISSLLKSAMMAALAYPTGGESGSQTAASWYIPALVLFLATFFLLYQYYKKPVSLNFDIDKEFG